jgi:transposase
MAAHYGTAIVPARPYKPRDKAKVEVGVQVVQRWILAQLRHRTFFSLAELNSAITALVEQLNDRPMRGWGTTRRALFDQFDRPVLSKLPTVAYEYADWRRRRVGLDYHGEVDRGFYSVPHQLLRQEVEVRLTTGTVEVFHRGKRVASHVRGAARHRPRTVIEHMPSAHRRYRDWGCLDRQDRAHAPRSTAWRRASRSCCLPTRSAETCFCSVPNGPTTLGSLAADAGQRL